MLTKFLCRFGQRTLKVYQLLFIPNERTLIYLFFTRGIHSITWRYIISMCICPTCITTAKPYNLYPAPTHVSKYKNRWCKYAKYRLTSRHLFMYFKHFFPFYTYSDIITDAGYTLYTR